MVKGNGFVLFDKTLLMMLLFLNGSGIVAKQTNIFFYEKFVDESKLSSLENFKTRSSYWVYIFSLNLFCLLTGTLTTFVGYNFSHAFSITMFCWYVLFALIAVYFFVRFQMIEKANQVFKKKRYSYLFTIPFFIIMIAMCVASIFTTKFVGNIDGSFNIKMNVIYYFLIFIPLDFGYLIFCHFAFLKCFGKYVRKKRNK